YDKQSEEAYMFFKIVQNKLHYAITGHTAAELIYERVNADKENMGLTTWKEAPNGMIYKYDVSIAKNYLNETEIKQLNNLTTLFLDYAESMAEENQVMTMKNWIEETDNLLKFRKKEILQTSGKISHKQALEKAENEYEKFKVKQDMQYISSMDEMYQRYLNESKE
ncbi:MAG: virulence RhuM family protein, partial [Clostridia bacterium]|nr:virulence RhuM family protein [Clostridia bacterium]